MGLVECMRANDECVITGACRLQGMLSEARDAFLVVLDRYTLADILESRMIKRLSEALGIRVVDPLEVANG